jgi:hypothetical protein
MVVRQILVLFVLVRIQVGQQKKATKLVAFYIFSKMKELSDVRFFSADFLE